MGRDCIIFVTYCIEDGDVKNCTSWSFSDKKSVVDWVAKILVKTKPSFSIVIDDLCEVGK